MRAALTAIVLTISSTSLLFSQVRSVAAPCVRPQPRTFAAGEVVRMAQPATYPCVLELVETGLKLTPNRDGTIPDPGENIVRDSRGRIYAGTGGIISVWRANGTFERMFGRQGDGPQEFRRGNLMLFMDGQDRLHVLTGSRQWSVLSPSLEWVSQVAMLPIIVDDDFTVVTEDGTVISSIPQTTITGGGPTPAPHWFSVADFRGNNPRTFGDFMTGGVTSTNPSDHGRQIAYAGNQRFWASPERNTKNGMSFDLWGLDGKLQYTLRREVSWFPPGTGLPTPQGQRPTPAVFRIGADTTGLLYAWSVIANPVWDEANVAPADRRQALLSRAYEAYIDVIDTRAGVVLASLHVPPPFDRRSLVTRFMPRSSMGYRHVELPDGLVEARFFEMRLRSR